jgi:hypothetical protein
MTSPLNGSVLMVFGCHCEPSVPWMAWQSPIGWMFTILYAHLLWWQVIIGIII